MYIYYDGFTYSPNSASCVGVRYRPARASFPSTLGFFNAELVGDSSGTRLGDSSGAPIAPIEGVP